MKTILSWLAISCYGLLFVEAAKKSASEGPKMANRTIEKTIQLRTHSLFAPYIDQDLQNRWWDFGGDAYVNTNKYVRLTRPRSSEMGWLWSRLPITAANFVIELEFKISGATGHLHGDGLALWLLKDRVEEGPVFGNADKFNGLGIFIDTYANSRHSYSFPSIMAMLGDGMTSYDLPHDGESNSIGACSVDLWRATVATKLRVVYVREGYLEVQVQHRGWDDWENCFKIQNVNLPLAPFLGFSALTGDIFDAHDIITVTSSSAMLSAANAPLDKLGYSGSYRSSVLIGEKGSWLGLFIKLALVAGVCAGGWWGWKEYKLRQGHAGYSGRGFSSIYANGKRF